MNGPTWDDFLAAPAAPVEATNAYCDDTALAATSERGTPDPEFDLAGRVTLTVNGDDVMEAVPVDEALVVSSGTNRRNIFGETVHRPVIDLDIPARLVPSTTPGHHHLYLDVDVPTSAYLALLDALVNAGVIEPGYVAAARARGATQARLPWVRKIEAQS